MAEVAKAFVTLIPSFKGGKKAIERELNGVLVPAGKKEGKKGGAVAAAALGASVRKVGLPIIGAAGAALGLALTKGMGRLMAIEEAEAKLSSLGHSAKSVETIMNNALAAVKGTAFGLDEAATIAASVVAAGVKPGKDLERTLKLVADAATVAGSSMGEMGAIFNKVAAGNRLSMEEVNQLSDRGIPILQFLAKQFGVTALEAREMVSAGEVDFKEFRKAIEDNMAGAALESGNTTRGAFENVKAALGRFGAALLSGVFPNIKTVFGQLIEWIDDLTAKVGPFADKLTSGLGGAFKDIVLGVKAFFSAWSGGSDTAAQGRFRAIAELGQEVKKLGETLAPIIQQIVNSIQQKLLPAVGRVGQALLPIAQQLLGFFKTIAPSVGELADTVVDFVASLMPIVEEFATKVGAVLGPALKEIGALIKNEVVPTLIEFINFLKPAAQWLLSVIGDALVGGLKGAVQVVKGALHAIVGILRAVMAVFRGDWSGAWEAVKTVATGIWEAIKGAFKIFINVGIGKVFKLGASAITKTGSALWNGLKGLFNAGKNAIVNVIRGLWNTIKSLFTGGLNAVKSAVSGGVSAVLNFFRRLPGQIWSAISSIPSRVANAFRNATKLATSAIRNLPSLVKGAMSGAGTWLINSGRQIIQGLINGIKGMAGRVKSAVKGVLDQARRLLPFSPAKEGPFSGRGWTLYSGRSIVEGLAEGIAEKEAMLRKTIQKTLAAPQLSLASASVNVAAPSGGDTFVFNGRNLDINEQTIGAIIHGHQLRARVRRPR